MQYANVARQASDDFEGGEFLMAGATDWGMVRAPSLLSSWFWRTKPLRGLGTLWCYACLWSSMLWMPGSSARERNGYAGLAPCLVAVVGGILWAIRSAI